MWQPIETAPRNKPVLVWCVVDHITETKTHVSIAETDGKCWMALAQGWGASDGHGELLFFEEGQLTHWMPLPDDPPK